MVALASNRRSPGHEPSGRWIVRQTPVERQELYYNEAWQVVEVRRDEDPDPLEQWVWDSRYVDAAVVRFYDANTDGDCDDAGDNVLYPIHDANWNVTGVVDAAAGGVAERYVYTPYGTRTVLAADWRAEPALRIGRIGGQSPPYGLGGNRGRGRMDGFIRRPGRAFCQTACRTRGSGSRWPAGHSRRPGTGWGPVAAAIAAEGTAARRPGRRRRTSRSSRR